MCQKSVKSGPVFSRLAPMLRTEGAKNAEILWKGAGKRGLWGSEALGLWTLVLWGSEALRL